MPQELPTKQHVEKMIRDLSAVIVDPEFIAAVEELRSLPRDERGAAFDRIASTSALSARGVKLPDGLRTSPRYFEPPNAAARSSENAGLEYWVQSEIGVVPRAVDRLDSDALASLLNGEGQSSLAASTAGGVSVCVSGGYGICVSVGYQY